jgi:hypothetical protein
VIGHALEGPELGLGNIPLIQLLVVNKETGVPGDSGLRWLIKDDEQRAKLSLEARRALRDGVQEHVFGWRRWRNVLAAFGLDPLELSALPLQEIVKVIATTVPYGGEGEDHLKLKQYVAKHPTVIKLTS